MSAPKRDWRAHTEEVREAVNGRQKFLPTADLRREIVAAVGIDPDGRFGDPNTALRKRHLVAVARALGVTAEEPVAQLTLAELYPLICNAVGGTYQATAGNQWGINRPNLKRIHAAVTGSDEVGSGGDGA